MAEIRPDLRYTEDHEWARADADDADVIWIGITDFAQAQLGDIVMVELPSVGDRLNPGDTFGTVESPKSVSDLLAPVGGEVIEVNDALDDAPELVNSDCYGAGWLVKVRASDPSAIDALLDAAAYGEHVAEADH